MRKFVAIILLTLLGNTYSGFSQTTPNESLGLVKWLDIEQAQALHKTQPKPIMIDFYTDWCGWCKHMMNTTFSNPTVAHYINTYFYPVRFNAETKDTVEFLGKKYGNKNSGNRSPNELSVYLLDGKLSYPTLMFYHNNYQFKLLAPGYSDVKAIEPMLIYTVEYIFNTTSVQDFQKYYTQAFYPDTNQPKADTVSWLAQLKDAEKCNQKQKRKTLLFVNTDWCNGGKTMLKSTFNNSEIAKYILTKFYAVSMNAQTKDSLYYQGKVYTNIPENQGFHPLFTELSGGKISLPCILFFDENMKFITLANQYITPDNLKPILEYIGENVYLSKTWNDYMKSFQKQ